MAKFFGSKEEDEDAGKAVEAKFKTIEDTVKSMSDSQTASAEVTKSLAASVAAMNARFEREDAERVKAENTRKQNEQNPSRTAEEEFEEFGNNPKGYIARQNANTLKIAAITSGKVLREEVLAGKEYYYGDIKKKVISLLENTTDLNSLNNVSYILNCYNVVLGENLQEIAEGKIKKQTSLMGYSDASSEGRSSDPNAKPTVEYRDQKTAAAAAAFGLTEEDLIKTAKEGSVHGLEVVA